MIIVLANIIESAIQGVCSLESSIYYRVYIAHAGYDILGVVEKLSEVAELIEMSMEEIETARYIIIQHINEFNMDNPFGTISNSEELSKLKEKALLEEQTEEKNNNRITEKLKTYYGKVNQ